MPGTGFWWILFSILMYSVLHSLLAAEWVKTAVSRWLGHALYNRFYRLFFVITGGVTFLPTLLLTIVLPDQLIYRIPNPWVYLTVFIQGAALAEMVLVVMQTGAMDFLGLKQLLHPEQPPRERLIVDGLYRYVRHPLYTLSLLIIWLTPTLTWNTLALNLGVTAYLWIGSIFEERKLAKQFGEEYKEYQRRTGRILPGIKM